MSVSEALVGMPRIWYGFLRGMPSLLLMNCDGDIFSLVDLMSNEMCSTVQEAIIMLLLSVTSTRARPCLCCCCCDTFSGGHGRAKRFKFQNPDAAAAAGGRARICLPSINFWLLQQQRLPSTSQLTQACLLCVK
jgi:hypothetical protein